MLTRDSRKQQSRPVFNKSREKFNHVPGKAKRILPATISNWEENTRGRVLRSRLPYIKAKECTIVLSNHCVPFKSFDPCHVVLPFLSFFRIVVFTLVGRSGGKSWPRSSPLMRFELAQTQVRFQVKAKCLRIQNATLNTSIANQQGNYAM